VLLGAKFGVDGRCHALGGPDAVLDVVAEVVGEYRARIAHRVAVPLVDRHPVVPLGGLLEGELELELPADLIAQCLPQLRANRRCRHVFALPVATDAQRGTHIAHRCPRGPAPAPVADLDPERRAPPTRVPEAKRLPAGGGAGTAEWADLTL